MLSNFLVNHTGGKKEKLSVCFKEFFLTFNFKEYLLKKLNQMVTFYGNTLRYIIY